MSYQITTLKNGLRIASEHLAGLETVSLAISVNVGARNESEAQHGISHLLEHMAFKGTSSRTALDIAESFDAIGGHLNAYTSHENTVYYAKVLKENLPLAAEILCDILQDSLFDEAELEREKQVILQELAMHHDTPDDVVFDLFQEAAFASQALGRSILGTSESIVRHSQHDLKDFVATHYRPSNFVITAAGNVDHEQLVGLIESHLDMNAGAAPAEEVASYKGGTNIVAKDLEQLQLLLGVNAFPITDERYYTLQLLATVLGGGMSSRLFQEVREKRGLVYTILSFTSCYQDCGIFAVYAATGEEESKELFPVICEQWQDVCEHVSEEELQRAKNQHLANLLMARENSSSVAEWIGRHLLQFGEYRSAETIRKHVEAITKEEVMQLARELFDAPHMTVAGLGLTKHLKTAETLQAQLAA